MNTLIQIFESINIFLWGYILVIALGLSGLYLTIKHKGFQFSGIRYIFNNTVKCIFKKEQTDGISPFQAVCTALGGTIGVGNTIGVAFAICRGGAGAVFWMWVSALLGMIIKYAEIYLAVLYKSPEMKYGGPMLYIEKGLKSPFLSKLFCVFCILTSFGMGNMSQSNAMSRALSDVCGIPMSYCGLAAAIFVFIILIGGAKRIVSTANIMVPFVSLLYIILAVICIIANCESIIPALKSIFSEAFGIDAISGAITGKVIASAVRFGFSRGIFTNEAGLGSAPIIHSSSTEKEPAKQAVWGIFEVFTDTILVCTLTALVILTSPVFKGSTTSPEILTRLCFSESFGLFGDITLAFSMLLFALASILCWSYYGSSAADYLSGGSRLAGYIYILLFSICVYLGSAISLDAIWSFSDLANALMLATNLFAVIKLRGMIKHPQKR